MITGSAQLPAPDNGWPPISPRELDHAEVEAAIDSAIPAHKAEQATWPRGTDCARLDNAFEGREKDIPQFCGK